MSTREQRFFQQGLRDFSQGYAPRWSKTHIHYNAYISGWNTGANEWRANNPSWLGRLIKKVKSWIK